MKFLIGIAPNGAVVFVSAGYPDKQLTISSGVLDHLQAGDGIMADKGFLIDDLLPDGKTANVINKRFLEQVRSSMLSVKFKKPKIIENDELPPPPF